jgi:hypothetical protein
MAVMSNGSVLIANTQLHAIVMWNPGKFEFIYLVNIISTFYSNLKVNHQVRGIALDSSLNLYVADTSNQRIQRYQRLS